MCATDAPVTQLAPELNRLLSFEQWRAGELELCLCWFGKIQSLNSQTRCRCAQSKSLEFPHLAKRNLSRCCLFSPLETGHFALIPVEPLLLSNSGWHRFQISRQSRATNHNTGLCFPGAHLKRPLARRGWIWRSSPLGQ